MDVWSAGCIMAEMITGKTLFKGNDRILRLWGQVGRAYPPPVGSGGLAHPPPVGSGGLG